MEAKHSRAIGIETHLCRTRDCFCLEFPGGGIPPLAVAGCCKFKPAGPWFGAVVDDEIDLPIFQAAMGDAQRRFRHRDSHIRLQQAVEDARQQRFQAERKEDAGSALGVCAGLGFRRRRGLGWGGAEDFARHFLDPGGGEFAFAVGRQRAERNDHPALTDKLRELLPRRHRERVGPGQDNHPPAELVVGQEARFHLGVRHRAAIHEGEVALGVEEGFCGGAVDALDPGRGGGLMGPMARRGEPGPEAFGGIEHGDVSDLVSAAQRCAAAPHPLVEAAELLVRQVHEAVVAGDAVDARDDLPITGAADFGLRHRALGAGVAGGPVALAVVGGLAHDQGAVVPVRRRC